MPRRLAILLLAALPACASAPPLQAVLPGTDAADGSTTLALPRRESTRIVDALGVSNDHLHDGGTSMIALTTEPNTTGALQVTVHERHTGSLGEQWRTSVGVAAFVAATTLNLDLLDYAFTAEARDVLDGPSASGLMTAGFLAAMTGADIEVGVTMTGTINPDGTIGPVGGIPEKFKAAIDHGKRRLGYPIGQRMARSEVTGELVDLEQLASSRGARAVEVRDVRGAYALLTGRQLPEVVPVAAAEMALEPATIASLAARTAARQQAMAARIAIVAELAADPATPAAIKQVADRVGREVATAAPAGSIGAYVAAARAWQGALVASTLHAVVTKALAGDTAAAVALLDGLARFGGTDHDTFDAIAHAPTAGLADQLRALAANRDALDGWATGVWSASQLATAKLALRGISAEHPLTADAIVAAVEPAVSALATRAADDALAADDLAIAADHLPIAPTTAPALVRLEASYRGAASAAIAYLDSIVIPSSAAAAKSSEHDAKLKLADKSEAYLTAHLADRLRDEALPAELARAWGQASPAWQLLSLAGGELGYIDSTMLVAEMYSLGVRGDRVSRGDVFTELLAAAERAARASAHEARIVTGAIPVQAKLAYQRGAAAMTGTTRQRLTALAAFWDASLYARTALMLARK